MLSSVTAPQSLLSPEERAAIAEIEATTSILQLVTRLTNMRFAGIAKFTDQDWIVCSAYDPMEMGINVDDVLDLETTLCSEFCVNPQTLFIPKSAQTAALPRGPWSSNTPSKVTRERRSSCLTVACSARCARWIRARCCLTTPTCRKPSACSPG